MLGMVATGAGESTGARAAAAVTNDVAGAHDQAEGGNMVDEGAVAAGAQDVGASGSKAGAEQVAETA